MNQNTIITNTEANVININNQEAIIMNATDVTILPPETTINNTTHKGKLLATRPVNDVLAEIPKIQIIENVTASGTVDGLPVSYPITQKGYKMVGHMQDDKFHVVPWLKSTLYRETSHDFTLGTLSRSLDGLGLQHGVWKSRFERNLGIMRTDLVLDKQYRINEDVFENTLKVRYNDQQPGDEGLYQPMIILRNSFYGASSIEFALVRIICTNGMMRIADSMMVKFQHLEKALVENFQMRVERFLESLFGERVVENLIANMSAQPVILEYFLKWLIVNAGPQATEKVVDQFNLGDKPFQCELNQWMAYNMVTWVATHVVKSVRERNLMAHVHQLKGLN